MYDIIRQIINYTGSNNYNMDSSIVNCCIALIPVMVTFFMWQFTKLIAFVINPKRG